VTEDPREGLEEALDEIKRVIVGQDPMLERLLVALRAGGHVLLEGVPGLAKTLTVKTLASVLGGSFRRVQFPPDLVPSDLVGTRVYRPDTGRFDTELGPVFGNFLLADEINRAPAKVQSALLEVMQERQVTIGGETFPLPRPFLVLATQNRIESEGTCPLPERRSTASCSSCSSTTRRPARRRPSSAARSARRSSCAGARRSPTSRATAMRRGACTSTAR
jgi:MoxR-like ATPase